MQARKAHLLERVLFVALACTLVFAALCIYTCLVSIYESRWPPHAPPLTHLRAEEWPAATSCIYHARWTTPPQPVPGQSGAFQSHTSFLLPGDLETFLLSSQDRHASGIVFFFAAAQSTTTTTTTTRSASGAAVVEVEALYESEEALRTEKRSICALRRGRRRRRGQYGIGVFAVPWHQYTERDDITFKITFWLPMPRAHAPPGDPRPRPPHAFDQVSMDAPPIEADTIDMPNRYIRGKFNVSSSSSEAATAFGPGIAAAGVSEYINNNNNDLLMSVILSTTDAQIVRRMPPASIHDGESDGFFHVDAHSLNSPLGIRFFGQAPGEVLDLDIGECNLGTVPLPCTWGPFQLLATNTRPSVNATVGMEDPTGRSRNRCVNSRIVRQGVCLVPDVTE